MSDLMNRAMAAAPLVAARRLVGLQRRVQRDEDMEPRPEGFRALPIRNMANVPMEAPPPPPPADQGPQDLDGMREVIRNLIAQRAPGEGRYPVGQRRPPYPRRY